jgi:voltage-gated potassium channel
MKFPHNFHPFNFLIIFLSFYVLIALAVDAFVDLPYQVSQLLRYIDHFICLIFLTDFCIGFYQAKNKWHFMRWGWIDLISSIPAFDFMRVGRLVRLVRLLRVLRAFRSARILFRYIFRNRIHGTFATISTVAILVVIFSAIAILEVEADAPGSNIKTAGDALWWAYVTVTSVGYGDKYPVTTEGRFIAAILMTVGVGLFGTFTALIASWFVAERKDQDKEP